MPRIKKNLEEDTEEVAEAKLLVKSIVGEKRKKMKNVTDKADAAVIMGKGKAFLWESKCRKCAKQRKKGKNIHS